MEVFHYHARTERAESEGTSTQLFHFNSKPFSGVILKGLGQNLNFSVKSEVLWRSDSLYVRHNFSSLQVSKLLPTFS